MHGVLFSLCEHCLIINVGCPYGMAHKKKYGDNILTKYNTHGKRPNITDSRIGRNILN